MELAMELTRSLHLIDFLKDLTGRCVPCKNLTRSFKETPSLQNLVRKFHQCNILARSLHGIPCQQESYKQCILAKILQNSFKESNKNALSLMILEDFRTNLTRNAFFINKRYQKDFHNKSISKYQSFYVVLRQV